MSKKCIKCCIIKEFIEFRKDSRTSDGTGNVCKNCENKHRKLSWSKEIYDEKTQILLNKDPNYFTNNSKICIKCNKNLLLIEYPNDKRCLDTKMGICKECLKIRNKSLPSYKIELKKSRDLYTNSEEYRNKKKLDSAIFRKNNNEKVLLSQAKNRATKFKLEFNLTIEDIIIPKNCPILNIPLFRGIKKRNQNSPSIDRINNTKGYIKGNIKIISNLANTMKNNATPEQLKTFSENIINYINGMI